MAWPVITVPSGGIPVVNVTATRPSVGLPATVVSGYGTPVTVVTPPAQGLALTFVSPPP